MMLCLLLALSAGGASADPVKIQSAAEVQGWTKGVRCNPNVEIDVVIAFKNLNMEELGNEILAVSSPRSPRYGQHLTHEDITALTGQPAQSVAAVSSWLEGEGLPHKVSRWADRVVLRSTTAKLERLFATRVHYFVRGAESVLQAEDLYAPKPIVDVIGAVFGLHGTPLDRPEPIRSELGSGTVTPSVIKQQYNISGVDVKRGSGSNKRATVEFGGQFTKQADLTAFFKQYVPHAKAGDEVYSCFSGADHCEPDEAKHEREGGEAALDIQYMMGSVPGIKTEVWNYAPMPWCTQLKRWTSQLIDAESPPQVFSISYGIQGNVSLDNKQGCSEEITRSIEQDFAKIAARGITLIFASGDDGAGGNALFKGKLWPVWPGSAPHTTTVGATQFIEGSAGAERAVTAFGSGGGFDFRWDMQPWQKDAAQAYLANPDAGLPRAGDFNAGGRATPDVSALGQGYQVTLGGHTQSTGGTSASAPVFASIVSLLNEYRLQNGKSPLGFLNPLIYEMGKAGKGFSDVTVGANRVDRGHIPTREGYSCTKGWDAVTGWGTPKFQELLEYVKGLPSGRREAEVVV